MTENIPVLLIHHDRQQIDVTVQMLRNVHNRPFQVEVAYSIAEGFQHLGRKEMDVVLLDMHFLVEDTQVLQQIHTCLPHTASVVLIETEEDVSVLTHIAGNTNLYVTQNDMSPRLLEMTLRYALEHKQCQEFRKAEDRFVSHGVTKLTCELAECQATQNQHLTSLPSSLEAPPDMQPRHTIKEEFLALIAHEMRTPLASIVGFVSMMTSPTMSWPLETMIEYASIIEEEAQRMSQLIEQLTDHTRQQTGTLKIDCELTSLETVIRSSMPQLRALTTEHHLLVDIPSNLPRIQADPQRLAQVLTNLVGNAARYSKPQTRITLHAQLQGNDLQVDVIDEGRGIPPDQREKVFEPFHQTDRSGTKGLGLGLALCKDLIERHRGRIWVQDYDGPGTIMSFTLPIAQD